MTTPARDRRRTPGSGGPPVGAAERSPRDRGVADGRRAPRGYGIEGTAALQPQEVRDRPAVPRLRVAPPRPVAVPRAPFVVLVLAVVIGGVLGILLLNTKINENAFRLDDLHGKQAALGLQEQQLRRELAEKGSAGNLEAEARRLGLVPADQLAYLRLPDGRVIGVPRPASGQPSVTSQTANGGR
jgi:hypothetical protein